MPLFEVETDATSSSPGPPTRRRHGVVREAYPSDKVIRMTKRPRDTWVISKGALGLTNTRVDVCATARDCLSKAAGDKVHAIRLYMHETGDRPGAGPQGHRVEYGHGLVALPVIVGARTLDLAAQANSAACGGCPHRAAPAGCPLSCSKFRCGPSITIFRPVAAAPIPAIAPGVRAAIPAAERACRARNGFLRLGYAKECAMKISMRSWRWTLPALAALAWTTNGAGYAAR